MISSPEVEVGILKAERINFRLSGKFETFPGNIRCYDTCAAYIENGKIIIQNADRKYQFDNQLSFSPCNISADKFIINDVVIGIEFHWEKRQNQVFQGTLKLRIVNGLVQVINIIPVENYLVSVISSEMKASSSLELLKAHAIISRSWLMAQLRKHELYDPSSEKQEKEKIRGDDEYIDWSDREDHEFFHVCADDHCQRYQGIEKSGNPSVIRAVNETYGEVLVSGGKICDTRYSKCCGGKTELYENCWENAPRDYLQTITDNESGNSDYDDLRVEKEAKRFILSRPDAFCNTSNELVLRQILNDYDLKDKDYFRWMVKYSQEELAAILKERSGIDFGAVIELIPLERGPSGRITRLRIKGEKHSLIAGKELVIRKWLSETHLYSSAFIVEAKREKAKKYPSEFIIKGAGWGHGVGLCQIGAAVMSEQGYPAKKILMHYYKNAKISKIYR